jgi:hypothetical protein
MAKMPVSQVHYLVYLVSCTFCISQGWVRTVADSAPAASSASQPVSVQSDIAALVDSVRKVDAKIHVELEYLLKAVSQVFPVHARPTCFLVRRSALLSCRRRATLVVLQRMH